MNYSTTLEIYTHVYAYSIILYLVKILMVQESENIKKLEKITQ